MYFLRRNPFLPHQFLTLLPFCCGCFAGFLPVWSVVEPYQQFQMFAHDPHGYKLGCTVFGNTGVGKTSLCKRFIDDEFSQTPAPTIGIHYFATKTTIDSVPIILTIIDTAGIESCLSLVNFYNRGRASFVIGVYDITNRKSFEDLDKWLSYFAQPENVQLFLIGTKSDLSSERQVSTEEAQLFAEKHSAIFYEACSCTGQNVTEIFERGCRRILKGVEDGKIDLQNRSETNPGIKLISEKSGPWYDTKGACF